MVSGELAGQHRRTPRQVRQNFFLSYLKLGIKMFSLSHSEKVVSLEGFPQSSIGAPCPAVIATEHSLALIFFVEEQDPAWDGTSVRVVGLETSGEIGAVIQFERPSIHTLGPPNDEAFGGHRLAKKGLEPYGAFEVINSEWIQLLEKMNSVHHRHNRERFLEGKRHFIITFHDSVFECVACSYGVKLMPGSVKDLLVSQAEKTDA